MELVEIPEWMEKFIIYMTEGEIDNLNSLSFMCSDLKSWQVGIIANLNAKIELLNELRKNQII